MYAYIYKGKATATPFATFATCLPHNGFAGATATPFAAFATFATCLPHNGLAGATNPFTAFATFARLSTAGATVSTNFEHARVRPVQQAIHKKRHSDSAYS